MPLIIQMFPYIVPPEIQVEIDKQAHLYEGMCNWINDIKQSVLRGEDCDLAFRVPKTPAYQKRKQGRTIKPIPEEIGADADESFNVSSSSMQSSVSSVISEVSMKRSRRTAAMKANFHIKTQVNVNLNAKMRQPSQDLECDVQSSIVTHSSDSFHSYVEPPIKKVCLDSNSTVSGIELSEGVRIKSEKEGTVSVHSESVVVSDSDDDDVLLSELSTKCGGKGAGSVLNAGTGASLPASEMAEVKPDSCKLSEISSESELGCNPRGRMNMKSARSTRGHSKALDQRCKRVVTQQEEVLKRPNSPIEENSNVHSDDIVEDSLCVNTMVKRAWKDTVSIPRGLAASANDPKLSMKVCVSLMQINISDSAANGVKTVGKTMAIMDTSENVTTKDVSDGEVKVVTGINELTTKVAATNDLDVLQTKQNAVESDDVPVTEQRTALTSKDAVIEQESAVVTSQNAVTSGNADVTVTNQDTSQEEVAISGQQSPKVERKRSRKSDHTKFCSNTENTAMSETTTRVMSSRNSRIKAKNVANESPENKQNIESRGNTDHISSHGDGTNRNYKDKFLLIDLDGMKKNCRTSLKTGNKHRVQRKSVETSKSNTSVVPPSQFVLDSTFTNSPGKTYHDDVLADISNTMNTSLSLRENFLKDFQKAPQNFSSSHLTSTPWFSGSSSVNSLSNWNAKVVLSNQKLGSASEKRLENTLKTPTCRSPVVFSPYAKESVKNRVAKFENLNTLVEVADENTDPGAKPPSVRVTRTKTRALAAAAAAVKNAESDTSVCDTTRKNYNAAQNSARKSLKKALRISAAKLKKGYLTPNTSRDDSRMFGMLTSSMKKYNNVIVGLDSFLPRANKLQCTLELEKKKEEEQRRQKERAEEACRKKEIMLNAKAMEKKKKNEEKLQKVAGKREAQQRVEQERRLRLEREREEKMVRMMHTRDEKLREEQLIKRQQLQQKLQEVEERRRQEEATRLARIRDQEEQEARRKEQLEKERAAEEKAMAREQALLQKHKTNTTFTCQPGSTKSNKQDALTMDQTYNIDDDVTSYKISDVEANNDEELTIDHTVPKWAKRYQKVANNYTEFVACSCVPEEQLYELFGDNEEPDLTNLLGLTAQQVATCRRKSSMFPPRTGLLKC